MEWDNKEFVLSAVRQKGWALQYARKNIKNEKDAIDRICNPCHGLDRLRRAGHS